MTALAGVIGAAAFAWLTLFQVLLAGGAPLGHLAWGGTHRVLPPRLRLASAVSAMLTALGAVALGQAGGLFPATLPPALLSWLLWAYVALFTLSFVGNLASQSLPERLHGVPLTAIVTACSLWLAIFST